MSGLADGRLRAFKKGPIKMAIKAKVRIVPVSICNLYRFFLAPFCPPSSPCTKIPTDLDPSFIPSLAKDCGLRLLGGASIWSAGEK